uniref:DUF2290 domain-containing protein n=1 Tax=Agathobacter sp. TaxID=2021311 RepID=UPI004057860C
MGKSVLNPKARDTVIQINSTLRMLEEKGVVLFYNEVSQVNPAAQYCQITWHNHISGRANAGNSFLKLQQYMHILRSNSYHCMLFDGSLIRVNFEFENNELLSQNLLWWPAPYSYADLLQDGYSPVELLMDFYGDPKWHESIVMRSPVRIDFDSKNNTEIHPHSHMHIQNGETRINTVNPMCFNRFIDFVFRNFYPDYKIVFSEYDYIKYKIPEMQEKSYNSSTVII